ncbi:hypothetical protein [Bradyrhizobium lablabi]|uniref:hypothetical protein n=1 Tax=Bradyrhizobium lablabi TaxID=722472 RepID=UPI000B32F412|nr:hypothetical protein [Bradyrhizobium lablabi]
MNNERCQVRPVPLSNPLKELARLRADLRNLEQSGDVILPVTTNAAGLIEEVRGCPVRQTCLPCTKSLSFATSKLRLLEASPSPTKGHAEITAPDSRLSP